MLHEPGHIGERNDPNPPTLLEMGESVLKWVLAAVGLILVLSGLLLSLSVFGLVKDLIIAPEDNLGTYFDGWEQAMGSLEKELEAPQEDTPAPSETETPETAVTPDSDAGPDNATEVAAEDLRKAQGVSRYAEKRATETFESGSLFMEFVNTLLDALKDGRIGRPIGAIFILLLAALLIKIPFYLLKLGIHTFTMILAAQKGDKPPAIPNK